MLKFNDEKILEEEREIFTYEEELVFKKIRNHICENTLIKNIPKIVKLEGYQKLVNRIEKSESIVNGVNLEILSRLIFPSQSDWLVYKWLKKEKDRPLNGEKAFLWKNPAEETFSFYMMNLFLKQLNSPRLVIFVMQVFYENNIEKLQGDGNYEK